MHAINLALRNEGDQPVDFVGTGRWRGPKRDEAVKKGLAYAKAGTRPYPPLSKRYDQIAAAIAIDETRRAELCLVGGLPPNHWVRSANVCFVPQRTS